MKPLLSSEIKGNWATLLLTTDINGSIDYFKLSDEIDVLIASNPNGIYSNGTAGEFYTQTEEEFDRINLQLADKCEKAGIPFQVGVSHMSAQISLNRLKRICSLNPGAVQVILPDWIPVTNLEIINFLKKMEQSASGIGLVLYLPNHAKNKLIPRDWSVLKKEIKSLIGLKVFDDNGNSTWYDDMRSNKGELSVFIPGHRLASGISLGASGSYSNMACLNPFSAQRWYEMLLTDMNEALDLEKRVKKFMKKFIEPLILENHYSNPACDRFLAVLGGWADIGEKVRWPYLSVPTEYATKIRLQAAKLLPEFIKA